MRRKLILRYASTFFLFLVHLCFVLPQTVLSQEVPVNPTRPSVADNGFLTAYGYLEIEMGWAQTPTLGSLPLLLKMTPDSSVEAGLSATGLANRRHGEALTLGTPGAQLKWQLSSGDWGALASVFHIDWPANDPPTMTLYPVLSIRNASTSVDISAGASASQLFSAARQATFFYALSVSPNFDSPFSLYAEIYGFLSGDGAIHALDSGISFAVSPGLVLDFAVGTSLTSSGDDWTIQLGLTTTIMRVFH